MESALAVKKLDIVRKYSTKVIASVDEKDWYTIPPSGVSNVVWQVGHLAAAQYRLGLLRTRDERPEDASFVPPRLIELYGKGSVPSASPNDNLPIEVIRKAFDAIHQRILLESPNWSAASLQEISLPAHPMFQTKLDALWWCSYHEMLHVGQIGLIRRSLGHAPSW